MVTLTKVPFEAIEAGGFKNNLIDGNSTCWIDHSRCAHAFSASERRSWSRTDSISTLPPATVQSEIRSPLPSHRQKTKSKKVKYPKLDSPEGSSHLSWYRTEYRPQMGLAKEEDAWRKNSQ